MPRTQDEVLNQNSLNIFQGGGEMGALMRAFDWDNHPLGNPANWPESLKTNIRLLLNSGFPMFLWWSKDLYMFNNDAYLPALGNKHPESLGAKAPIMWAEIWEDISQLIENILAGGDPFYAEALLLVLERKGFSEETYWTFSYSPAFNDYGEVNGIFCACSEETKTVLNERRLKTLKDVSEKTALVLTLEESGQLTCDILHQNPADLPFCMIYLLDNTTTIATLIGKAGYLPDKAVPTTIDLSKPEPDWRLADVITSPQISVVNCSDLNLETGLANGQYMKVKQAAVLPIIRPGQNQVIGFLIAGINPRLEYNPDYKGFHTLLAGQIATSLTSIQVREELARQQQYLIEIFQQAPVGIAIVRGPEHIIDLANPGVCEIWGRKPEDVLGKTVREALPEVVEQGLIGLLDGVYNTGVPFMANELPVALERNGELETVYLNFIYHPMRNAQGVTRGVIAIAIDISEQVKYRRSVEGLNEELLSANADLDNFVYAASHDLKAPISNIEGLMHALLDELPQETLDSPMVEQVIQMIQSSVNRFKKTVLDLTEVTKIQRQAGDDVTAVKLTDVVTAVQLDLSNIIKESGAQIEKEIAQDAVIEFSAKNVRSIVYNLLSNAIKYRSPERKPYIRITATNTPDQVLLSVTDNGLGMDLSDKNKIFSMFKRLHDHVEGSGIGLYIVKRIVENAGGSIEVESEIGVGSTFRVYFKRLM